MTPIHLRRWWAATAVGVAGSMLTVACGASGGGSAPATITPASPQKPAGYAGTSGPPSPLATAMPSMSGMPSAAPRTASAAKPVAGNAVTILNFAFGPQVVTVKPGTTVHWTNRDSEAHTVTSDTGAFNSPVLQPGAGFSFMFAKPGTYSYHCTIHPFMTGKVVVS
jgi:plastocyanin